jgi:hypothetical protein
VAVASRSRTMAVRISAFLRRQVFDRFGRG